jgi:hypothetical protein
MGGGAARERPAPGELQSPGRGWGCYPRRDMAWPVAVAAPGLRHRWVLDACVPGA